LSFWQVLVISQGAGVERMNLLKVALKCINSSPADSPSLSDGLAISMKKEMRVFRNFPYFLSVPFYPS